MTEFREKAVLMDEDGIRRALMRIAHEIVEKNKGTENLVLVGIRTRGVPIAARIAAEIARIEQRDLPRGVLDITLYRDDLNELSYQPIVHPTEMPLDITGKTVVLVDDVLYIGSCPSVRTMSARMSRPLRLRMCRCCSGMSMRRKKSSFGNAVELVVLESAVLCCTLFLYRGKH